MMNGKWLRAMALLLLLLLTAAPTALAAGSVTAKIPFTVENALGTVIMEALDGAPAPRTAGFSDVSEGTFEITFTGPDNYFYRIYQREGTEEKVHYDATVYDVGIYVMVDGAGELYYTAVISIGGDAHKPDSVVFENTVDPDPTAEPDDTTPQTGDDSQIKLWLAVMALSFLGISVTVILVLRRNRDEE